MSAFGIASRRSFHRLRLLSWSVLALPLVLLVTLTASPSWARDIFVDNVAGNDRFDGLSRTPNGTSGPAKSIQRGLNLCKKGDRLIIANNKVPYRECVSVQAGRHTGSPSEPFQIIGNGATLDGSAPIPREAWQHVRGGVFRYRPKTKSHQQLFRDDRPLPRVYTDPAEPAKLPNLKPLQWCLHQGHVYFHAEQGMLPERYNLTNAGLLTGITVYEARWVVIEDLVVQGFAFDGVNAHDSAMDIRLQYLTCRGNGRSGIRVGGSSRVRVEGCVLGSNGAAQLQVRDYSRVVVDFTKMLGAPAAPAVDRKGGLELEVIPFKEGAAASASKTKKQEPPVVASTQLNAAAAYGNGNGNSNGNERPTAVAR